MTLGLPLLAAGVLLAATLLGFLGSLHWTLDLFAHFRFQYLLALLGLVALFALARRWSWAAASGVGAALNLAVLLPFLLGGHPPPAPGSPELSLSLLNVRADGANPRRVIAHLREREDDVVVLMEAIRGWVDAIERSGLDLHVVAGPRPGLDLEILVLARDPDLPVTLHRVGTGLRSGVVEVLLSLGERPIRLLAAHPISPLTGERARRRDAHLAWVGRWVDRQTDPVVVVGDLNATPWSHPIRRLVRGAGLVNSLRGHGLDPSWPAALGPFAIPIDHVLHGPELTTVARELGPSFGSDHRMVGVRMALRP